METNLRPLTLGEILDRTAQLYRTNFVLFAGIFAVTNGGVLVLALLFEGVSPAYRAIITTHKFQPGAMVFLAVAGLLGILLYGVSTAAITRAVAWVNLGEPATIRTAYASTLPRLGRYLWLMTLMFLVILGAAVLAALAVGIVTAIVALIFTFLLQGTGAKPYIVGVVVGLLFDVGVFAVVAWLAARYALAIPACVVEDLNARKALRRSVELSKGSRGRIFLLFLLVTIVQVGLLLITQIPFYFYLFKHQQTPLWLGILSQIINVATNTLVGPILAAGLTLFYFDQRVRKEGYDIEWMMKAAGLAPESTPPQQEATAEAASEPTSGIAPQSENVSVSEAPGEHA